MAYCSDVQRNEKIKWNVLAYAKTCINFNKIMLNKRRQTQIVTYYEISFTYKIRIGNVIDTESSWRDREIRSDHKRNGVSLGV